MSRSGLVANVLLLNVLTLVSTATDGRPQVSVEDPGVSGYVLRPDDTPVSAGLVIARMGLVSSTASIDPTGRFVVVPARSGVHQVLVSVPGFAPFRFTLTVPASRSLRLPIIRLFSRRVLSRATRHGRRGTDPCPTTPIGDAVCILSRGSRAIVDVELPAAAGPQFVRVPNDRNQSMDDVLMPNPTAVSIGLDAFHLVRSLRERTSSRCRAQMAAGRNPSASPTAMCTQQSDEGCLEASEASASNPLEGRAYEGRLNGRKMEPALAAVVQAFERRIKTCELPSRYRGGEIGLWKDHPSRPRRRSCAGPS